VRFQDLRHVVVGSILLGTCLVWVFDALGLLVASYPWTTYVLIMTAVLVIDHTSVLVENAIRGVNS